MHSIKLVKSSKKIQGKECWTRLFYNNDENTPQNENKSIPFDKNSTVPVMFDVIRFSKS